ncbi:MAG: DNA gyrase inhibitor YacG [Devosia sp.]
MAEIVRLKPTRPCPICGKPSSQQYHPFCSARCQDIDLNRWLSGVYVVPAKDEPEDGDDTTNIETGSDEDGET